MQLSFEEGLAQLRALLESGDPDALGRMIGMLTEEKGRMDEGVRRGALKALAPRLYLAVEKTFTEDRQDASGHSPRTTH